VHHGRNVYCIDKNYGGTLCIFDRLFGTFQEELDEIPIVYGTVHPINTFNPIEANLVNWRYILPNLVSLNGLRNKLLILWNGPGWIPGSNPPEEYPIPPTSTDSVTKYDPYVPSSISCYILAQFVWAVILITVAIDQLSSTLAHTSVFSVFTAWTLLNIGGISDREAWVFVSESARLILFVPLGTFAVTLWDAGAELNPWFVGFTAWSLVSLMWLASQKSIFAKPLRPEELGRTLEKEALAHQTEQHRRAGYVEPSHHHQHTD